MNCASPQESSLWLLLSSWEIPASSHVWEEVESTDLAEGIREETKSIAGRRNEKQVLSSYRSKENRQTGKGGARGKGQRGKGGGGSSAYHSEHQSDEPHLDSGS